MATKNKPQTKISAGLQEEYQAFFNKKLKEYGADSPEDLDEDQKKKFFNEIELEWEEGEGPSGSEAMRAVAELGAAIDLPEELQAQLNELANLSAEKEIAAGLQEEYQEFFDKKLAAYGVDSPEDLDEDQKKKFFNEIELEWEEGKGPTSAAALRAVAKLGEAIELPAKLQAQLNELAENTVSALTPAQRAAQTRKMQSAPVDVFINGRKIKGFVGKPNRAAAKLNFDFIQFRSWKSVAKALGALPMKQNYKYTDDYAGDSADKFGRGVQSTLGQLAKHGKPSGLWLKKANRAGVPGEWELVWLVHSNNSWSNAEALKVQVRATQTPDAIDFGIGASAVSAAAIKWKKVGEGILGAEVTVKPGNRVYKVNLRIDSREKPLYLDMKTLGPWEAVGRAQTIAEAKALAKKWMDAVHEQQNLHPKLSAAVKGSAQVKAALKIPENEDPGAADFLTKASKLGKIRYMPAARSGSFSSPYGEVGFSLSSNDDAVHVWVNDQNRSRKLDYDAGLKALKSMLSVFKTSASHPGMDQYRRTDNRYLAAEAQNDLSSGYRKLTDLKLWMDAMDEIPNSMMPLYKATIKAMSKAGEASKAAYNARMHAQRIKAATQMDLRFQGLIADLTPQGRRQVIKDLDDAVIGFEDSWGEFGDSSMMSLASALKDYVRLAHKPNAFAQYWKAVKPLVKDVQAENPKFKLTVLQDPNKALYLLYKTYDDLSIPKLAKYTNTGDLKSLLVDAKVSAAAISAQKMTKSEQAKIEREAKKRGNRMGRKVSASWWKSGKQVFHFKFPGGTEESWEGSYVDLLRNPLLKRAQTVAVNGPGHGTRTVIGTGRKLLQEGRSSASRVSAKRKPCKAK